MKLNILALSISLGFSSGSAQTFNAETTETKFLTQTGVTAAWSRGITGRGSVIGVIDNGFDLTHTDIRSQIIAARSFTSNQVTWGSHGTAMASIAAGAANNSGTVGVAPDSRLILAQVGLGGTNLEINPSAIKYALDWVSVQKATVINMSFGSAFDSLYTSRVRYDPLSKSYIGTGIGNTISDYKIATDRGSILVTSAGNQGLPYSQIPAVYAVQTDASGRLVLGGRALIVGAVDAANQIASYSNRAGHLCQNTVGNSCRDTVQTMNYYVVAPGTGLQAATANQLARGTNTASSVSGTSGAAAYVSGGIALMRQAWPSLSPEAIVNIVLTTAKDLGITGVDATYGRGLVDFDRATRPQGQLRVAMKPAPSTANVAGVEVAASGATGTNGLVRALSTSSVLTTTQALDDYGRNYSVDLTKSLGKSPMPMNPQNPYLGFVGHMVNTFDITDRVNLRVIPGAGSFGAEFGVKVQDTVIEYQFGHTTESNGFLGNYGNGALGLGKSSTLFNQLGLRRTVANDIDIFASYAQGITRTESDAMSMVRLSNSIQTNTYRLGASYSNLLRSRDRLTATLGTPIMIKRGSAQVSGVVGYNYNEDSEGNVRADPITRTETIDLRGTKEVLVGLNYLAPMTKSSILLVQIAQSHGGYNYGINWIARY